MNEKKDQKEGSKHYMKRTNAITNYVISLMVNMHRAEINRKKLILHSFKLTFKLVAMFLTTDN